MADSATDRQIADLRTLLDVSRQLGAVTELLPLLKQIEQAALTILDCERVTVFLYDPNDDELYSKVATGASDIRFSAKLGIAGEAARARQIITVNDAYADARFNPDVDKKTGFHTRNLLTVPMFGHDGRIVGVLQILNKRRGAFTPADEERATTLALLAGVAVHRQMLMDEYAEKQRIQRDLHIAREIQQALLPRKNPDLPGYDVAGWNCPADETGGDCFDFIRLADNCLALMVADATGHGIGPALIVSECRALLRALATVTDDVPKIMSRVNRLISDDLPEGRFVTTFFGLLDSSRHQIHYVSAGHGPLLLIRATTGQVVELAATAIPLGILDEITIAPAAPLEMRPGDIFVVTTDGFFEWPNAAGELYGIERVAQVICRNGQRPMSEVIQALRTDVTAFAAGIPHPDDLTIIAVKRL
jgi:phosphoserine phosphatase